MTAHTGVSFGSSLSSTAVDCFRFSGISGSQLINPTGSNQVSAESCPIGANLVRIATDTGVMVSLGRTPDATGDAQAQFVPPGVAYLGCNVGDKIAVATPA